MRLLLFILLLVMSDFAWTCDKSSPCDMRAMEVFLPSEKRELSPNIKIHKVLYQTLEGNVNEKITLAVLEQIQAALNHIALASFHQSTVNFEVLAQLKLLPDAGAILKLQFAGDDKAEPMLHTFYDAQEKLAAYRSLKGEVYVMIHYQITTVK